MKTIRSRVVVVAGAVAAALGALGFYRAAAPSSPAPPTAVAIVDILKLMKNSEEIKVKNETMSKRIEPLQKEIKELSDDQTAKKKDLEVTPKQSGDYITKYVELKKVESSLKSRGELYQSMIDLWKGDMIRESYASASQAIARVAKRDGYQLVLFDDRSADIPTVASDREVNTAIQYKRVLFAEDSIDITDRVITEMNNAFNAPAHKNN